MEENKKLEMVQEYECSGFRILCFRLDSDAQISGAIKEMQVKKILEILKDLPQDGLQP